MDKLRSGDSIIDAKRQGNINYYDVLGTTADAGGCAQPWRPETVDQSGGLDGIVIGTLEPIHSAFYSWRLRRPAQRLSHHRRFTLAPLSLISDTLRQAEAGTYAHRPEYASHDEVGASLDLIDSLVMKQRKPVGAPAPVQRLSIAARTLGPRSQNAAQRLGYSFRGAA